MVGPIIKLVAYAKAPKATLLARHPVRVVSAIAGIKLLGKALPNRLGRKALGVAALLSVPVAAALRNRTGAAEDSQRSESRHPRPGRTANLGGASWIGVENL